MAIEAHPIEHINGRTIDKVKVTERVAGGVVTTYVYDVMCDACDESLAQMNNLETARDVAGDVTTHPECPSEAP